MAGVDLRKLSIGSVAAFLVALGGIWTFSDRAVAWLDNRAIEACESQIEGHEEMIGHLSGEVGDLWMALCDARREAGERVRWWRGECIEDRRVTARGEDGEIDR